MRSARLRLTILCGLTCLALASCDESQLTPPDPKPPGDTTGPAVVAVAPTAGATGVQGATTVTAAFSERLQPVTVTTSTFTVSNTSPVSGSVLIYDSIGVFTPTSPLDPNTTYTARITTGVQDLAGNALGADYVWTFTTGPPVDATPPVVVDISPGNGSTGVVVTTTVRVTFSELMNASSFDAGTLLLTGPSGQVAGTVDLSGATASFTPSAPLAFETTYTARVSTDAEDLGGNHLASDVLFAFTTAPAPDETRPEVHSVLPLSTEIDVDPGTTVKATFTEAMNQATVNASTFLLASPGGAVTATVTLADFTATLTPSAPLAHATVYTATITTGVEDVAGNNLANNYVWTFTTADAPDTTPPSVSSVTPLDGATGVGTGTAVTATFSEPVAASSVGETTLRVTRGGNTVNGTVTLVGNVATFTPSSSLEPSTLYTARITTGVEDLAGNNVASDFVWSFTTAAAPDVTPPAVTGVLPADGANDVLHGATVQATFSEPVLPTTVDETTFRLEGPGGVVPASVSLSGLTATLTPSAPLLANTSYTARVTTGVEDLAENHLVSDHVWTFTTAAPPDQTPPTVIAVTPFSAATNVDVDANVTATFSEPVLEASVNATTFALAGGSGGVSGTVTLSGVTATLNPTAPLAHGTTYTAVVTAEVEDLAGNNLADDFLWTFTTEPAADTEPPTVISTTPVDEAPSVDVDATIRATFSEAVLPSSVNGTTVTLTGGPGAVAAEVTLSGTTASLRPDTPLANSTLYTATVTTGVEDLAGNHLVSNFVWTFTTQPEPDTTPPGVGVVAPPSGAAGVGLDGNLTATFSEAVSPASVNSGTFTLEGAGGGAVAGTVSLSGETATFDPTSPLAGGTTFTARLTTGVQDLAGNALASDFMWSFSTKIPDTTAPTVGSVTPTNGARLVSMATNVTATFSESIDPTSVTSSSFVLSDGIGPVPGALSVSGATVTFNPTSNLDALTTYTATLTTGIRDLEGNALAETFTWTFETTHLAPTARAGPDQSVFIGSTVTLNGTGSTDPEGQPLTYVWHQVQGPTVNGGNDLTGPTPSFTAPLIPDRVEFQLRVSDGDFTSGPDRVRIDVELLPLSASPAPR